MRNAGVKAPPPGKPSVPPPPGTGRIGRRGARSKETSPSSAGGPPFEAVLNFRAGGAAFGVELTGGRPLLRFF